MKKLFFVLGILVCCSPLARAYRDLETGTFLTRDPIGYADGPNVYCYVHCNPITKFDAWGLSVSSTTTENDGLTKTEYTIEAEVVFEDDRLNEQNDDDTYRYQDERDRYVKDIKDGLIETYNGKEGNHSWSLSADNLKITVGTSASKVSENNHVIIVTSADKMPGGSTEAAIAERGGGAMWLNTSKFNQRTTAHESVHWFGMKDNQGISNRPDNKGVDGNITIQSAWAGGKSTELTPPIIEQIDKYDNQSGAINNGLGPRDQTETLKTDRELGNVNALKSAEPKPRRYLPGY